MKLLFLTLLFSCAQHQIGSDGARILIAKHSSLDKQDALKTAIGFAKLKCDNERVIIESKEVRYEGKLSEVENQKVKDKSNKSIMMGEGGMAQADYATKGDNLYHAEIRYRCK